MTRVTTEASHLQIVRLIVKALPLFIFQLLFYSVLQRIVLFYCHHKKYIKDLKKLQTSCILVVILFYVLKFHTKDNKNEMIHIHS